MVQIIQNSDTLGPQQSHVHTLCECSRSQSQSELKIAVLVSFFPKAEAVSLDDLDVEARILRSMVTNQSLVRIETRWTSTSAFWICLLRAQDLGDVSPNRMQIRVFLRSDSISCLNVKISQRASLWEKSCRNGWLEARWCNHTTDWWPSAWGPKTPEWREKNSKS